jgi:phospholipase/carboxylesterase
LTATGRKSLSLVHLLHGLGGNELSMASLADGFDPRFIVISVRSPIEVGAFAFAWFHETTTLEGPVIDADEAESGWKRAVDLTDEAVAAYGADPSRVFIAGFSQGGIIALAAMLTSPERFAGAVCMSGRLLPTVLRGAAAPDRLRGKGVMIVHGTRDETLSADYGRAAFQAVKQLPLSTEYLEFEMVHTTSEASLAAVSTWLTARLSGG